MAKFKAWKACKTHDWVNVKEKPCCICVGWFEKEALGCAPAILRIMQNEHAPKVVRSAASIFYGKLMATLTTSADAEMVEDLEDIL